RINTTRQLQMAGSQMTFRDTASVGAGNIARFIINQSPNALQVWDITQRDDIRKMPVTVTGNVAEFLASASELREYIAFSGGYLTPSAIGLVENQDLHALSDIDLVIVSSPKLLGPAERLAEIHMAEGRSVAIATPEQVFNEFSNGNPDVTAIKMLMKMLFDRAGEYLEQRPENLLLFGDGTIYNKGMAAQNGYNVITYQSQNSLSPTLSYVSDDYFVFLSDDDGEDASDKLDCGVGRIPAASLADADNYVNKVKRYVSENTSTDGGAYCLGDETESPYGPWRNTLVFVADDQDGNFEPTEDDHMQACEIHSQGIVEEYNDYDIVKLYLDAFTQESTPGGERYPEGEIAIDQRVQNGALLVTYVGHGGERGWAHERILDIATIQGWTNSNRMPVFLTATCELARYDDNEFESAGEHIVMNPDGGAIAMLTTTRIVYSGSNLQLGLGFFTYAFENDRFPGLTLGEINRYTKNWVADGDSNKRNFSLLGDPALQMAYPKYEVYTTNVNNNDVTTYVDTLRALEEIEIRGYVGNAQGEVLTGFNGYIYPSVYDKRTHVITQNNDYNGTHGVNYEYDVFNKVIYKGKASVSNGEFSFKFVVPYDINFSIDTARVSYYAVAGNNDAHGYSQRFMVGGTLPGAQLNTVGPEIELYLNDTTFVSGGITNESPVLIARLKDENGINTVGNGIGHDLQAILDNDNQNPVVLNDYYEADLDTYKSGEIRYQLSDLTEGPHTLSLKAWDVHNNSSQTSIDFVVASSAEMALEHVLNYPNPFTTRTEFMFEHNQVCTQMDVRIQVFTVGGKLVKTLTQSMNTAGTRNEPIAWDGRDDFGDKLARGVYVYKVEVRTETGAKAEKFEKLVILN
ncbi:MAG: type IX secretion system sortase PorU, partial [Flavobacteriales bacterium]|nr:type IX secretion system sortase PorU [Flavobacteriales bacterium]